MGAGSKVQLISKLDHFCIYEYDQREALQVRYPCLLLAPSQVAETARSPLAARFGASLH